MLTQPLLHQLHELRLRGMAAALEQQLTTQASNELTFDERLALLIQHELVERQSCRLRQRLRWAKLTQSAALEDLDLKAPRGLDRTALGQVTDLSWIAEHLNVLITGPTGVGKSYIGCAVSTGIQISPVSGSENSSPGQLMASGSSARTRPALSLSFRR
jgi:DNA replication protein DnaC